MLKSISFMDRLKSDLFKNIELKNITNFFIELRINQKVDIYIVSDAINDKNEITLSSVEPDELENKNTLFTFLTCNQSQDDDYRYLFEGDKISLGLKRSLSALLQTKNIEKKKNVMTFFSYKGGVGRTTSLAMTATYLSRKGKNVFVMDCDFEAPGLINFFNSSQSDTQKNGLVEYLNDQLFTKSDDIDDYVYNIEKSYSGSGVINLMPAGNVLSNDNDLDSYLEGLAKIDLQGLRLINIFENLIDDIQSKFNPDVILIDSRTGFNNIFGALAQISEHVVVLAGDDIQNQPGVEYVSKLLKEIEVNATFVLSILTSNFSRRYNNFAKQIQSIFDYDAEVFYFDRVNTLEFIGTPLGDDDDLNDFINGESGSAQYQKFFQYVDKITPSTSEPIMVEETTPSASEPIMVEEATPSASEPITTPSISEPIMVEETTPSTSEPIVVKETTLINPTTELDVVSLQNRVLNKIKLPTLYAEGITYDEEYIKNDFYVRPCMEDFLIPEKVILLGDKGTGKTAFYKALQNNNFFSLLQEKAQKKHLNYTVLNVTDFENDNFEMLDFSEHIKDELFIKKFWMFFIWNAICSRGDYNTKYRDSIIDLESTSAKNKITKIINSEELFFNIEDELSEINDSIKASNKRLIITFDKLDNIVKPYLWNDIISPLIKLCMRFRWDHIFPKLFLRRDLYERLGNLTNKNSFQTRIINLEWTQNEMFSYFLKLVFLSSKDDFFEYLEGYSDSTEINIQQIKQKLRTKGVEHNQLPLNTYLIKPIINLFFGDPKPRRNGQVSTAYEDLYRNIQSADKTVNLRPFIDLITNAISEQKEQDSDKGFRKNSILGLAYCTSKHVRKNAVRQYLEDLWTEQGNEFVKYFSQDLANNKVNSAYKKNMLSENVFEKLLIDIKNLHMEDSTIKNSSIEDLKQILIANKIITPYMVGSKTRYGFAYLYTNYFGI
jgi:cellulose biosynthesis protein BcsQ